MTRLDLAGTTPPHPTGRKTTVQHTKIVTNRTLLNNSSFLKGQSHQMLDYILGSGKLN
jgi:hypothetical protein